MKKKINIKKLELTMFNDVSKVGTDPMPWV